MAQRHASPLDAFTSQLRVANEVDNDSHLFSIQFVCPFIFFPSYFLAKNKQAYFGFLWFLHQIIISKGKIFVGILMIPEIV
jgi:hypothetical protein